jgi:hypothetical protein
MFRFVSALVLAVLVSATGLADVGPPRPARKVIVDYKITTEKDLPEYTFFTITTANKVSKVTEVKLDSRTPVLIAGAGRVGNATFLALPRDASKAYAGEKEFHAAILSGKVEGEIKAKVNLTPVAALRSNDPRTSLVIEYTVTKIDSKDGIVLAVKLDGVPTIPPKGREESDDPDGEEASASPPSRNVWVAGLAGSFAIVLGGLWLLGRSRREA